MGWIESLLRVSLIWLATKACTVVLAPQGGLSVMEVRANVVHLLLAEISVRDAIARQAKRSRRRDHLRSRSSVGGSISSCGWEALPQ